VDIFLNEIVMEGAVYYGVNVVPRFSLVVGYVPGEVGTTRCDLVTYKEAKNFNEDLFIN
jgi:hypothetical protein